MHSILASLESISEFDMNYSLVLKIYTGTVCKWRVD